MNDESVHKLTAWLEQFVHGYGPARTMRLVNEKIVALASDLAPPGGWSADEKIHDDGLEHRKVLALERLADRFAPEVSPSMTVAAVRAAEAWLDYDAGRSSSDPFQQALAQYRRAKDAAGKKDDS